MTSADPAGHDSMSLMESAVTDGYAPANGVQMYWRSQGKGGTPLVVAHGGFGSTEMMAGLAARLAAGRRVVSVELQGHGHTADIGRPFAYETFGDDLAALVRQLDLGPVDLLGYSLGGGASLRTAVQHPDVLRRLVLVSVPLRRTGWFPEVLAGMDQIGRAGFPMMSRTPLYDAYAAVAPDVDAFPALMDKTGDLLRRPYDWTDDVRGIRTPTLLVYADADSVPVTHVAEFFALLGGGLHDAGWDGAGRPRGALAILPGRTHYDIVEAPELAGVVANFLDAPDRS
ncbi:MAG TPA: alpha/beta hydrolase [Blastococcus sp.]|jgi:pimeloyl-ACP methyl ester carboxylesterase|nr:alpha/beta hydrolase [Blastococcus sp.]